MPRTTTSPRVKLSVTLRKEIVDQLNEDRGYVALSTYIDLILGIIYNVTPSDELEKIPHYPKILGNVARQMSRLSAKERKKLGLPIDSPVFVKLEK